MIVKTINPIIVKGSKRFSNAVGDKLAAKIGKSIAGGGGSDDDGTITREKGTAADKAAVYGAGKGAKTGYFSKSRRTERKEERKAEKDERRKKRKAKYGSRPLNPFSKGGKQFYKDKLPKLKKKANGDFEKTMPDGSIVIVKGKDVTIIPPPKGAPINTPPLAVETADLKTGGQIATSVENGETVVTNTYTENQTEKATDDKGQEQVYKKGDVVDEGSEDTKKPMSTGLKIGLALGGAAILGLVIYVLVKRNK